MSRGRKPAVAPKGRVTLQEAAELAGVAYAVVYQRVAITKQVPGIQAVDGTWSIARKDVKLIQKREPRYPEGRKPFYVRANLWGQADAWERAAGERGVTAWLTALADAASGYDRYDRRGRESSADSEARSQALRDRRDHDE